MPIDLKNFCTFYIVRHGQTDLNALHIVQGKKNAKLNETGKMQARNLGKEFMDIKFDLVFSSDLLRAKKTAEIIILEKKLEVITTNLIRERNFGKFEGKPIEKMRNVQEIIKNLTKEELANYTPSTGYETEDKLISRLFTFIREVAISNPGKNVLAVSHSGTIRAMLVHLGFSTYINLPSGAIGNTAYVKLLSDGVDFFIQETKGIKQVFK